MSGWSASDFSLEVSANEKPGTHLEQSCDYPGQVRKNVGEKETNVDFVSHAAHLPEKN
jgi:hypothetical protein